MSKLQWTTGNKIKIGNYFITCTLDDVDPIRQDSKMMLFLKKHFPLIKIRNYYLVDGFIEKEVGKWIKRFLSADTVFLEIGCGDMCVRRFFPCEVCYNAIDISLQLSDLIKTFTERPNSNMCRICYKNTR